MHRTLLRLLPLLAAVALAVPAAHAASPSVVVSQVYAAGGNTGAAYANDYVELFNRGTTSVDLSGWTIQYATAAGTSWQVTALAGSVAPGRRYLVQLASAAAVGAALPAPDANGTSNLAVTGGKIALVHDTAALICGASVGSCSTVSSVADLVGYGSASDYEGAGAAPAPSATTALVRTGGGCSETDSNAADFTAAPPAPQNSGGAAATCGGAPPPAATAAQGADVDIQIEPVLTIALERPKLSFGKAASGTTPTPIPERVTVVSNNAGGYSLTVHRTAFTPEDLPLGISIAGAALAPVPVAPAVGLLVGSSTGRGAAGGDVFETSFGFAPLPSVVPGTYTATVTFTVIGR